MKKLVSLIIIFIYASISISQQTFFTHIHDENDHKPGDILIKPDGNILFCSYYDSYTYYTSWSTIWELNQIGEIINEWTYTNSKEEFLRCSRMLILDEQIFLFGRCGKRSNDDIEEYISMRKFDLQLNIIQEFEYPLIGMNYDNLFPMRVIYQDSSFHLLNIVFYEIALNTALYLKISPNGTQLHSAFLPPSSGQILMPFDFYMRPDSDHLHTISLDCLSMFDVFGVFTEFDTAMNIIKQFPIQNSTMDFGILGDSDTSFYAIHNSVTYGGFFNSVVGKYDLNGNVLNQFVYESPDDSASWVAYRGALDTLPDGNLLLCTTKNIDFYPGVQQEPTQIMFFKLTPDLELIWQKFLFGDDGNFRAWSMQVHPDGGIVVLGTFSRTPPLSGAMEVFFMKTDSEGNLTVGVDENKQQIKTTEAILFPNPTSEHLNIEFSQVYQTATFQLMDISGKVVLEKQLYSNYQSINISAIPAGTYVYRIFNKDGLDERGKVGVE